MIAVGVAVVAALVLIVGAAGAGVVSALFGGGGTGEVCLGTVTASGATPAGLSAEQARNAGVIVAVGERMRVPVRGWVVAVATALQESDLINSGTATDHDSLGLFQQRPTQGWGTPEQIMNPEYAATKFYEALLRVPGWQTMALTDAAQAVQRSAYPDAYQRHEARATVIVKAVGSAIWRTIPEDLEQCVSIAGWTAPVHAPIVSGFRAPSRPGHDGVDLGAPRGTPIRAASAGTVVVVRCNIVPESYGCNQDGSPDTPGCGWYVDIRHVGEVFTRYCHMLSSPSVAEGQQVLAGQVIGIVGSSGHSSGPHLHFEVHLGDRTSSTAVDPVSYLRDRGVA